MESRYGCEKRAKQLRLLALETLQNTDVNQWAASLSHDRERQQELSLLTNGGTAEDFVGELTLRALAVALERDLLVVQFPRVILYYADPSWRHSSGYLTGEAVCASNICSSFKRYIPRVN